MGFFPPLLVATYPTFASFPALTSDGQLGIALDTDTVYVFNLASKTWITVGGSGSLLTIGAFDGNTASAAGLSIAASVLYAQSASATNPGMVNTSTQTFAGVKTFSSPPNLSSLTLSTALVLDASKNIASLAYTAANTVSTLVFRDSSGNFSATTITAALTGSATQVGGIAITGTPSVGYVPTATSSSAATWQAVSSTLTLTSAHILVGNVSNVATDVAVSGDLSLANTGAFTIANSAVTNAKIANSTIDLTAKVTGVLPNANTTATNANTASTIVARDASGNFIAGTITGALTGVASGNLVSGGALGTPASGTATNLTGLPVSTGISGLGTGVATFLATPSSANLAAALTDETGTGAAVFATSPALTTPTATQLDLLAQGNLRLQDASGGEYVAFKAPATVTTYTVTMPAAVPSANQVLADAGAGNGVMAWVAGGGGGSVATPTVSGTITSFEPVIASAPKLISSGGYTGTATDGFNVIAFSASGGPATYTLPAASVSGGRTLRVINTHLGGINTSNATYNNIAAGGADSIYWQGSTNNTNSLGIFGQGAEVELWCDGTTWFVTKEPSGGQIMYTSMTFTPTGGSGGSTASTIRVKWVITGTNVTMTFGQVRATSGTGTQYLLSSRSASFQLTGFDGQVLCPVATLYFPIQVYNNAANASAPGFISVETSGLVRIYVDGTLGTSTWTNSAVCGTTGDTTITYPFVH